MPYNQGVLSAWQVVSFRRLGDSVTLLKSPSGGKRTEYAGISPRCGLNLIGVTGQQFGVKTLATARILIVEDERLVAMDLQRRLTRLGHTVVSLAASGMEAIQKALALHPDVVLMDIRLQGDMDGVEAAQQIHASAAIPVIFMTAYVDADTQRRVGATSPWGCLYKPFSPPQVQSLLEHVLSRHPHDAP
jgi:CheY-like chemotaxis protein